MIDDLKAVLDKHLLWLTNQPEGARANLSGTNLSGADLTGANLTGADLTRADLTGADLTGANLIGANLTRADLYRADLTRANFYGANLTGTNFYGAKNAPLSASVSWTTHGECGRTLTALLYADAVTYCCGCFHGTEVDLRAYIASGEEKYRASRTIALDFVAARMADMIANLEVRDAD